MSSLINLSTACVQNYILQYFKAVIDKQTWSDEGSVSDRRLRSEVLGLACDLGYPPCVKKAHQLFTDWVESNSTLRFLDLYSCFLSLYLYLALQAELL